MAPRRKLQTKKGNTPPVNGWRCGLLGNSIGGYGTSEGLSIPLTLFEMPFDLKKAIEVSCLKGVLGIGSPLLSQLAACPQSRPHCSRLTAHII
jgi:hypothetical protein